MKKVYKLIDRSLILATEVEDNGTTIIIKAPLNVTQMMNPRTGEPEVSMVPMDLIFASAAPDKDTVELKKEHIMYEKPMDDFPAYAQHYTEMTLGIQAPTTEILRG